MRQNAVDENFMLMTSSSMTCIMLSIAFSSRMHNTGLPDINMFSQTAQATLQQMANNVRTALLVSCNDMQFWFLEDALDFCPQSDIRVTM